MRWRERWRGRKKDERRKAHSSTMRRKYNSRSVHKHSPRSPSCPLLFIPFAYPSLIDHESLKMQLSKPLRDDYTRRFINFFPALPLPPSFPAKSIFSTSGSISASAKCFFLILLVHLTYSLLVDRDNRTRARSGDSAV